MYYVLSVGTNIGDREENIKRCVESLALVPKTGVVRVSDIYETEPVGYAEQQNFYNICILVESELAPNEMLGVCLGIEAGFGRVRNIKNGPRILDVDLIFAENQQISTENLIVPHPRYHERRFVLEPLLDIFTDGTAFGVDFQHYLDDIDGQDVHRV